MSEVHTRWARERRQERMLMALAAGTFGPAAIMSYFLAVDGSVAVGFVAIWCAWASAITGAIAVTGLVAMIGIAFRMIRDFEPEPGANR